MSIVIGNEELIDIKEFSKMVGLAVSTLKVKQRAKEIPAPLKLKARTLWKKSEIEEYINKKEAE